MDIEFRALFPDRFGPHFQANGKIVTFNSYKRLPDGVLRLYNLSAENGTWSWRQRNTPGTSQTIKAMVLSHVQNYNGPTEVKMKLISGTIQ